MGLASILDLSPTGLLAPVLVDIKTTVVEDSLCSPVPCVFEFSKGSPGNPMTVGYRLDENISFHVDISQLRAPTGDFSTEEVEDCILLSRDMLRRENMTYVLYVGLEDQKGTVLREDIGLSISGDVQACALNGLGSRKSRQSAGDQVAVTSSGARLYIT